MGLAISREFFSMPDVRRPQPPPLTGGDALLALAKAESIDQYRRAVELSSPNRMARDTLKYAPTVHTVSKKISAASSPWPNGQIVWLQPECDNGLPHTRPPNLICLSTKIADSSLESILLHERVHVSQRLHAPSWAKIFRDYWSMTQWDGSVPGDILLRKRLNPDTILVPYFIWKKEWVPLGIFKSLTMPDIHDIDIVWWNTTSRTLHRQPPPDWEDFFGKIHSGHEHPYELSAYLIQNGDDSIKAYKAIKEEIDKLPSYEL